MVTKLGDGTELRVDVLADNLFRVRKSWTNLNGAVVWTESGLNRYGFLKADWPKTAFTREGNAVSTKSATLRSIRRWGRCVSSRTFPRPT